MNINQVNNDHSSVATFSLIDLVKKLGEKKASEFARAYRHAISIVDEEKQLVRIKCTNLVELIAKFEGDTFRDTF